MYNLTIESRDDIMPLTYSQFRGGNDRIFNGDNAYILGADVDKLNELADFLDDYAVQIKDCIKRMFGLIAGMEEGAWNGEVYRAVKEKGDDYKAPLILYAMSISIYARYIRITAQQAKALLIDAVKDRLEYF